MNDSATLTPAQQIAIATAHRVLEDGFAGNPLKEHRGQTVEDFAYWCARYRRALESVAEAFPVDGVA
jgi:hypothetical protein